MAEVLGLNYDNEVLLLLPPTARAKYESRNEFKYPEWSAKQKAKYERSVASLSFHSVSFSVLFLIY